MTTSTCAEVGNFLGNGLHQKRAPGFFSVILDFLSISGSLVTIIDTPGFGDDLVNEEKTIDELVDVLKNQVKFVHVFVIAFNGESPRMTFSLKSMIRLFEKMFGNLFWQNSLFEVTRWHFDPRSQKNRVSSASPSTFWRP